MSAPNYSPPASTGPNGKEHSSHAQRVAHGNQRITQQQRWTQRVMKGSGKKSPYDGYRMGEFMWISWDIPSNSYADKHDQHSVDIWYLYDI